MTDKKFSLLVLFVIYFLQHLDALRGFLGFTKQGVWPVGIGSPPLVTLKLKKGLGPSV